jgi:hypothetical protein
MFDGATYGQNNYFYNINAGAGIGQTTSITSVFSYGVAQTNIEFVVAAKSNATSTLWTGYHDGTVTIVVEKIDAVGAGSSGSGGSGEAVTKAISQNSHGFVIGDVVRFDGTSYVKASATTEAAGEVYGIVSAVGGVNAFSLTTYGYVSGLTGLVAGTTYYLSETAGALTATEPTTFGTVSKPILLADSTTSGYVVNMRGYVNGGAGGGGGGTFAGKNEFAVKTTGAVCNSSPCAIASQVSSDGLNNAVTSVTRSAAGDYAFNLKSGFCTSEPLCQVSTESTLAPRLDGFAANIVYIATRNFSLTAQDAAGISLRCVCTP